MGGMEALVKSSALWTGYKKGNFEQLLSEIGGTYRFFSSAKIDLK